MSELPFDPIALMREHPERLQVAGGLLTKKGAQDYVGCVPAISGVLFFDDAHQPAVREAVCQCFDEYAAIAKSHLRWLWREEPPEGPDKLPFAKAKPIREMMAKLDADDLVSFAYTSGEKDIDAGAWSFEVSGMRAWEAKMIARGTSALRFSLPILHVEDHPTTFQELFVSFARHLRALHGYGGHGLVLSLVRIHENQPFEAFLSGQLNGLDVGTPTAGASRAHEGLKTVSWLTAVSTKMVERVGGLTAVRSELPRDWFALYDYGAGLVIQAGPSPEAAPVDGDPRPARLVLPNALLKDLRSSKVSLHTASVNGEPRITGWAAERWQSRFDVTDNDLLAYKTKLLAEPKLTPQATLTERL